MAIAIAVATNASATAKNNKKSSQEFLMMMLLLLLLFVRNSGMPRMSVAPTIILSVIGIAVTIENETGIHKTL